MNGPVPQEEISVTLSERQRFGSRGDATSSSDDRREFAAADVLRSQSASRASAAIIVAVLQLGLLHRVTDGATLDRTIVSVIGVVATYMLMVGSIQEIIKRHGRASPLLVSVALFTDLLFVFGITIAATSPEHYERALFGTIVVVHVANFFFGRRQAWRVVQAGIGGYLLLITSAVARGLHVEVAEEVWTLSMCVAGVVLIVVQAGDVRRRLKTIVRLFEHAELGDFSREYDVVADSRPDAITRVGRAYNGVRAQLASMVLTDPLTGCLNRRGFDQALTREVGRSTRAGSEFALLAVDLDHFKQVNDTYGHLAGDVVLRAVGSLLIKAGRAGDVVARVGGEEFAILLAETGSAGAHLFATRLCELIREYPFAIGSRVAPVTITTSIGVAVGSPRGVPNFAELLWSRADDALYDAKRAGRDSVRAWSAITRRSGDYATIRLVSGDEESDVL
ncbi:MAG: GGDEF domain-containing protein [bacterium]